MDWNRVWEHLMLVSIAGVFTVVFGLLLGFAAHLDRRAGRVILAVVDVLQTIPALALLGIIMVFFGGSSATVIVGLVLYSLLPVVRNTCTGLDSVSPAVKEAALGMGMSRAARLLTVEFPIAFPTIFTGIRIAVVTSISVAVFGTFVGGGGLGSVIYRGIYVQDMGRILFGTAALMAMAVILDFIMSLIEKRLYRHRM